MTDSFSNAGASTSLVDAAQWLQDTLLGTLATTIAVIAIAGVGFGMLTGRIDIRRGATVVFGCFIVFGAPTIAAGLMKFGELNPNDAKPLMAASPPPPPISTLPARTYDPYAGASVPVR